MPFDLAHRRQVGKTALSLPSFGMGTAHLGGMYRRVSGEEALATLDAAWAHGIRLYDTAPWYGRGLSEHRLGNFLIDKPREEFLVTTKVGRVLFRPENPATFDRTPWGGGLNFEIRFDYTYDGVMRAYEQSLQRLALDTVDALLIHDPDRPGHGEFWESRMKDMRESGIKALQELKRNGDIKAIGMGLNKTESVETIAPMVELDFLIVAMPYTLLDQSALEHGLKRCIEQNISVIIGAPYASGILATGPGPNARYAYAIASDEVQDKARRIQAVCRAHNTSLQAAALQFPLAHPAVVSIIPGAARPDEIEQNLGFLREEIPSAMWRDLKAEKLIDEAAPTP